jgi:predicted phosphate transport protein (TIGR00153 family)
MNLLDLIPFFGRSKEEDTVSLIKEHMNLVYGAVESTRDAIEALVRKDYLLFKGKASSVNSLEDRADSVTRRIEENLYSGAFLAVSRSRILDFAEEVDNIADSAKDAVNIGDIIMTMDIDESFHTLLQRHMEATLECVAYLKKCVESMNNPDEIPRLIEKVREQEHKVDTIAAELFRLIRDQKYDTKNFIIMSKMFEFMDDISDSAEDASDDLKLIMLINRP